jgi:hypothetical protein
METPVSAGRVADILLVPRARLSCGAGWVVEEVHVETLSVGDAGEGGEDRKNGEELHLCSKRGMLRLWVGKLVVGNGS